MALHVLFDQGVVGLSLLCALAAGALWRTCLGNARQHALAPSLAGATIGFIVVGLFDSLLDVPRVAFVVVQPGADDAEPARRRPATHGVTAPLTGKASPAQALPA